LPRARATDSIPVLCAACTSGQSAAADRAL
jgi:hypothetical protein